MRFSGRWIVTLTLAAIAGGVIAVVLVPVVQRERMLEAIASEDSATRQQAWTWWSDSPTGAEPRALASLDQLHETLNASAGAAALLDASNALRRLDLWGWDHQPEPLLVRTIRLRTQQDDEASQEMALELLNDAPAPSPSTPFTSGMFVDCVQPLLKSTHDDVARRSLDTAISWLAAQEPETIADLDVKNATVPMQRTWLLACGVLGVDPDDEIDANPEPDTLDAALLARVLRSPDDTHEVLSIMRNTPDDMFLPRASILAQGSDSASWDELDRLAREGGRSAEYARQARSSNLEYEQAQLVFADTTASRGRRILAAWRSRRIHDTALLALLGLPASDRDSSVYTDVLLAERHLSREQATQLAEQWIRSFDDRRKRAGALLAALLGEHGDLLAEAYRVEDVPAVRTIQYLALHAMGRAVVAPDGTSGDPRIIAHRALYAERDDFDPDIALIMLIGGDREALVLLTAPPRGEQMGRSVQQRAWLIQRFVPDWHARLGRPIGGDLRGVVLHFDALRALRLITQRSITFDDSSRVFRM